MLKNPTSPENRFLYLTVWSFQVSKPDDLHLYAQQAKKAGFQGIGLIINWDRIQPERGKFDWTWLDECLDILVEEDVQLALGLMFWTGPLPWADELCVMQTAQGQPYVFDSQRGSTLCLNNPETLSVARDTIAAWAEHTSQRYGKRIVKYSTHFSVYGEVEYSPVGIALDFSPSEQAAFRAYMHARAGGLEAINRDYNLELADWAAFDAMPVTDLVMMDLKHMDPEKHQWAVGASNRLILANARRLVETGKPIIFRTPVVPTVNDTPEEIGAIAAFVAELQAMRRAGNGADPAPLSLELLPFHRMAGDKYNSMGLDYRAKDLVPPTKETMAALVEVGQAYGIQVRSR